MLLMLQFTICGARPPCTLLRPIWFPFVLPLPLITGCPVTWLLLKDPRKMSLNYALGLLMYSCRFCS